MHDAKHRKEDPLLEMGYEKQDINIKVLGWAAFWFFIFTFVCYGIGWLFFVKTDPAIVTIQETTPPFSKNPPPSPNPLLQTNITTKTDIKELRQKETEELTTSALVDAKSGVYRIPVDRAIDLMARRGLPQRPANVKSGGQ